MQKSVDVTRQDKNNFHRQILRGCQSATSALCVKAKGRRAQAPSFPAAMLFLFFPLVCDAAGRGRFYPTQRRRLIASFGALLGGRRVTRL